MAANSCFNDEEGTYDPYEEWYSERSLSSNGTLQEQEHEQRLAQQRQQELEEEYYLRSLPRESYPVLKPLVDVNSIAGGLHKRDASYNIAAAGMSTNKRPRQQ